MSEYDAVPSAAVTADLGEGPVAQPVTSWSIDRTLSGGGLPGQARAASGSSVATGTVTVLSPARRTPWTPGAIAPGGVVTLAAAHDAGTPMVPQGRMVVRSVEAPGALTLERTLSIEDDLFGLRSPALLPPASFMRYVNDQFARIDAAWILDQAARAGGYFTTPPPAPSCIASLPMAGNAMAEVGTDAPFIGDGVWETSAAGQMISGPLSQSRAVMTQPVRVGQSVYVTFNLTTANSTISLVSGAAFGGEYHTLDVFPSGSLSFYSHGSSTPAQTYFVPGLDPAWPGRVQVHLEWTSATSARVRARSSATAAWSSWATLTGLAWAADAEVTVVSFFASRAYALQVSTAPDAALWTPATAVIAASGSPLSAVLVDSTVEWWTLAQEVAAATMGAVWIAENGTFTYRNRDAMRGSTTIAETVLSTRSLEDVPWSISIDDVADRVEVTYRPPDTQLVLDGSLTVWESTDVVAVRARGTVTIVQDLEGSVGNLAPWRPVWDTSVPAIAGSRWAASTRREGGGPQPASDALTVTAELLSPSRVRIRITNNTTGMLYTVGDDGTTRLTLRASTRVRPGESQTLSSGVPEGRARNPLSIDLGSWVQDDDVAREMLAWLAGTVSQPMPVLPSIRVVPKMSRRLGDVIRIKDPHTSLAAKALVVGVHNSGSDGSLTQSLDLAILATTFNDFDAWMVSQGIANFFDLDLALAANNLTSFDALDDFIATIGGLE